MSTFKLVLLGEKAAGKSSCGDRFVKNEFYEFPQPAIGTAFMTQTVPLQDCTVTLEIWDTKNIGAPLLLCPYYRHAAAALIVYDITDQKSFAGAQTWIKQLQSTGPRDIIIGIAGNKADLGETERQVQTSEAKSFADENGCIFFETSAKTGENVNNMFLEITRRLLQEKKQSQDTEVKGA